jgi:hypothetical protein
VAMAIGLTVDPMRARGEGTEVLRCGIRIRLDPKAAGIFGGNAMIMSPVVLLAASIVVAAMIYGATLTNAQESVRSFTGLRQLTSSEGYAQICGKDRPLTLYLRNGIISDKAGCSGSIQPNGTFEGVCDNPQRRLNYRGQVSGSDISLNLVSRFATALCRWSIQLHENK